MAISVKIVVGGAMALVVLIVASVTLAITYTVSIDAVRTSGQRLAGSMADTVVDRVASYMQTTEDALEGIQQSLKYPGFMVPIDDPDVQWWPKWKTMLRALFIVSGWDFSDLAVITDDGGLIVMGTWWGNRSWSYQYGMDAHTLASTKNSTLVGLELREFHTFKIWTNGTGFYPDYFQDQRSTAYYYIKNVTILTGKNYCLWSAPIVNTFSIPTGDFVIYALCTVTNNTGNIVGIASAGRRFIGISKYLSGTVATPNSQVFIIDNGLQLVASTYVAPAWTYYDPGENGAQAGVNGCSGSQSAPGRPERVGCRAYAWQYPYGPLKDIASSDPKFINGTTRDERYGELAGSKYYYVSSRVPSRFTVYSMNLVLFMPESDVLGNIQQGLATAIGVTAAVFVIAVVVSFILLQILLSPLDEVAQRMYRVANLESDDEHDGNVLLDDEEFTEIRRQPGDRALSKSGMTEIRALQSAYETMDSALQSFTRYVPRDVVRELVASGQMCEITMRSTMCSVLFVDIANFTSICERVPPPILSGLVRQYFERSSRIVMGHGGIIDKFIGDCVMAVWGAPIQIDKHEVRSAVCAHMLVYEVRCDPLKKAFNDQNQTLEVRVGVASGEVLAGNMGSAERMSYTVIGDDVNLAARLESLNKQWGTNVLISETTALECQDWLVMRHVATIAVVGKEQPVPVFEVFGVRPNADTDAVGAVTSAASENRSLTEVVRDREKGELAEKYLATDSKSAGPASVGKLLRRAMKKSPVSAEDITWAAEYSNALALYEKRDFAGCLHALRNSSSRHQSDSISLKRLTAACERYIQSPPGADFTGVWQAEEK